MFCRGEKVWVVLGAKAEPGVEVRGALVVQLAAIAATVAYATANAFLAAGLGVAGRSIALGEIEVGTILSAGALAAVLAAPAWGYLSESTSRRRLMLIAVPVVTLTLAAMAVGYTLAPMLPVLAVVIWLALARVVQAAFAAALIPVAQSYVAELTLPGRRVSGMGLLSMAVSLGALCGALLLWTTAGFGFLAGLITITALCAIAYLIALVFLPETRSANAAPAEAGDVPLARIWPNFVITFFGFLAYTLVQPMLGYRLMDRMGLDSASAAGQAGLLLSVSALALIVAQTIVAIRQSWDAVAMLRIGGVCALVGSVALIYAQDVLGLALAMAAIGVALGFMLPANLGVISLATGSGAQGKVGGINMAARSLGVAAGPLTGAWLYSLTPDAPFWAAAALVAAVLALTLLPQHS